MLVTDRNYADIMGIISQMPRLYVDTETTGLRPHAGDRIIGISVCGEKGSAWYFPYRHVSGNISANPNELVSLVNKKTSIYWNATFDIRMLMHDGMHNPTVLDSMLALHLLDENRRSFALKKTAVSAFGAEANAAEKELEDILTANLLDGKGNLRFLPADKVARYACDDVILTRRLTQQMIPFLEKQGLMQVWEEVSKYAGVVAKMMARGVLLDVDLIEKSLYEARQETFKYYAKARKLAGRPVNLDSSLSVSKWLGTPNAHEMTLTRLEDERANLVLHYRKLSTAIKSYYKPYLDHHVNGYLHPEFLLHGTISGRLSCKEPNMQSLPRDTKNFAVKSALLAPAGYKWIVADYRQAEIRLAAHYGKEESMIKILTEGGDPHGLVAAEVGMDRNTAKRLGLSIVYGIGYKSCSDKLNISMYQASTIIDRYKTRFPGFARLLQVAEREARRLGYIKMWTGRRRHYKDDKITPYRKASSNLVQGGVSEILRKAQTDLDSELSNMGVLQILQTHDSANMICPDEHVDKAVPAVREIMQGIGDFRVPMTVDIQVGNTLANLEEIK